MLERWHDAASANLAQRPLRIGLFTDSYLPQVNGVAISVSLLAGQLRAIGHTVFVIAPHFAGYREQDPYVVRLPSVRFMRTPPYDLAVLGTPRTTAVLRHLDLDMIHTHTPLSMELLGYLAARLGRLPLVGTYHTSITDYTHYLHHLGDTRPVRRAARGLSALSCNICDQVVAPSAKIERLLRSQGVYRPIQVIPNGLDLDRFHDSGPRGAFRRRLGLADDDLMLLALGRIESEKSLDFVIEAFARVAGQRPKAWLVLAGDGGGRPALQDLAAKSGAGQRILFPGMIARDKVPSLLHDADVFLTASTTETQCLAMLEAITCGLPVVAVRDDAFQGMAADGANGWLTLKNLDAFSSALRRALAEPATRQAFGRVSATMSQKYSIQAQAAALVELYRELVAERAAHRPRGLARRRRPARWLKRNR